MPRTDIDWAKLGFGFSDVNCHIRYVWKDGAWGPAQFVKDVETAVKGRCPIETCLCSGGNIMSREAIVDSVRRIMEGK